MDLVGVTRLLDRPPAPHGLIPASRSPTVDVSRRRLDGLRLSAHWRRKGSRYEVEVSLFPESVGRGASLRLIVPMLTLGAAALAEQPAVPGADRPTLTQRTAHIEGYERSVAEEEALSGPHSDALVDLLTSLGAAQQELGAHSRAIVTFERALQVVRVNRGLYTLDQAPIIRLLIESERALGDFASSVQSEDHLLRLASLNPDDPRSVPIFRAAADKGMAAYSAASGVPRSVANLGLWRARRNYAAAIRTILRGSLHTSDEVRELIELERGLIRTYYLQAIAEGAPNRRGDLYYLGRESHRRLVVYRASRIGTVEEFAKALVELADWDLVFARNGKALDQYVEAYEMLVSEGVPAASIREIFSPETPVLLPTFLPNPLAGSAPDEPAGHIDVSFELGKYGTSRKVEVLDVSGEGAAAPEKDLVKLIVTNRFRPRLVDGVSDGGGPYQVRYYVSR
jgi:hypothetical protein